MEQKKITPEERLLKIIENPKPGDNKKTSNLLGVKTSPFKINDLASFFKGFRINKEKLKYLNLKNVNKGLVCFSVIITNIWIIDFVKVGMEQNKHFEKVIKEAGVQSEKPLSLPSVNVNVSDAYKAVKDRNIFISAQEHAKASSPAEVTQAISTLKLVGILWSNTPQAMIEDSAQQKTFLVSAGDVIGNIKVKQIMRDRAILIVDGQEQEIR
ncbi:MAG: hypothetical protein NTU54_04485 [Candidatus Omnitrophica bacterium]|nr:hypothetical protein [Candidatus Omnitrophota bacterium]